MNSDLQTTNSPQPRMKIIVVGSGIAGLIAALRLSEQHHVTLVTKAHLEDSNTRWAQGGIAAAMFSDDSIASHIADTLAAGAGLCDPSAVDVLCTEGPARIRDLIRLGVRFDKQNGELARGLEAAHSHARVLHAGGDSTGLSIETALVRALKARAINTRFDATPAVSIDPEESATLDAPRRPLPRLKILEHTFARDLVLNPAGHISGLKIITEASRAKTLPADAIILASGGAGQLFLHTTNPAVATGDGIAMALRAGAQLADLEFYQFHPTALAIGSENANGGATATFLISEAVRGEGAVLRNARGERFMQPLHPAAELAPRDVVARGIAREMSAQNGTPIQLDATALNTLHGDGFLRERFPTIDAAVHMRRLDWAHQTIPVTPAAHYWMGGIRTDLQGRTSIPGLYAVGEAACTGVHGANRLASNSLLESLVFAWRTADHLLTNPNPADTNPADNPVGPSFNRVGPAFALFAKGGVAQSPGQTNLVNRPDLQHLMWQNAGIERSQQNLEAAATQLASWHANTSATATVEDLETANLLDLARAVVASALTRTESRGAHFRLDYPTPDPAQQHSSTYTAPALQEELATC